ncbi:MAG: hypothetical protein IPI78_18965 [Chitinophagaceae bacterium]|nr:hypothetical protein [Chitinophagaceae bacterium]
MFSSISWQSYISIVAVLLAIYYAFVLYVYYRKDIVQVLTTGRNNGEGSKQNILADNTGAAEQPAAENYIDELKALIHQAGYSHLSKDELVFSLQQLLGSDRFETIKTPDFKKRLGKIITYECQTNCSMHLDEEDLQRVWVGK